MKRYVFTILTLAALLVAPSLFGAVPDTARGDETKAISEAPAQIEPIRIDPWQLLQSDGGELYQQMCASCHGAKALGNGPAARTLGKYAPPLVTLSATNVPREHWTYVIQSPCDDKHHRTVSGVATMPCWQRAFREALGNDASPMLVTTRLVDYLETIQISSR